MAAPRRAIAGTGISVLIFSLLLGVATPTATSQQLAPETPVCHATGQSCDLGIDPDIYAMPLFGELIQSARELICVTRSWSALPPEAFGIELMRAFWHAMSGAEQAQAEAASFVFVTSHWGPPALAPADLADVLTPDSFADEPVAHLASRTTRIEFEVPKTDFEKLGWQPIYLPQVSVPPAPDPAVPHRIRGWYMRGDGITAGGRSVSGGPATIHPLIILSSGFPYSIAADYLVGGINPGEQNRRTAAFLVASGFDVLFFDKRGIGFSEGLLDGMGEDVFRALDQLERGVIYEEGVPLTLTIITPDGRRLSGAAAAAERLLGSGYTARTKPVVLRGFSYGSSQMQKAMAMNYSDLPIEYRFTRDATGQVVVDHARMPLGNRGYNFRGIVAISGFQGTVKFETIPYFLALDAVASTVGHNGGTLKSTVFESMDGWPAWLGLYATNDFETADGAVAAYNDRLTGDKDIQMVTGYHFGLASEPVDGYFAWETERFARRVVSQLPVVPDFSTTTYAREVCEAESVVMDPVTQTITDVPSIRIRNANRQVDAVIGRWIGTGR